MTPSWRCRWWKLGLTSFLVIAGTIISASGDCALAQITPDGTLGAESSVVTPTNNNGLPTERIDGGATRGANLFHSFEQFSVPTGGAAYFNNALDIQNIISRVTGSSISSIDGLLRANGTANLFLLNPNGIIFGPNATLAIGGSFVGSTASAINFADGKNFSGTAPQATPLLTVSVPIGLQYGGTAGGIQVQQSILQLQTGQTLALIGGDVSVESGEYGFLAAPGGRIELGGLGGAGIVEIEGQQFEGVFRLASLRFPDSVERSDVLLTNLATVYVAAGGDGSIAINARNIDISGDSILRGGIETNLGFPGAQAGDITLNAIGTIAIANSSIFNDVRTGAVGKSGNIDITTGSLSVTNGAQLGVGIFEQGDAGSVTINARDTVSFDGEDSDGNPSGAFSTVEEEAVGKGGGVKITTGSLSVTNGAQLSSSTRGQGDAGSVTINARDTVSFDGEDSDGYNSGAFSTVEEEEAVGNGGGVNITTGLLSVTNGAQLSSSTYGQGDAGSVTINARDTVSFNGEGRDGISSQAASTVEEEAEGKGGSVEIATGSLSVTNGAQLQAGTEGRGDAGSVTIDARDTVSFDGENSDGNNSGAFSTVKDTAVGNAGGINIQTGSLSLTNGAVVNASTSGEGDAGSITITAKDSIAFDGQGSDGFNSGVGSQVLDTAVGNGGGINITTGSLSLTNGALLTTSSAGSGAAGNIEVAADSIRLENLALLSSETTGGQGNINLNSQDLVLRHRSNITTNATGTATGGNITLDTDILTALENSDITANALEGPGGRVIVNAQGIFGTQFRNQQTLESDITASSDLGPEFSGTVEINTPDVDPTQGLATLPAELVDASVLIASSGCATGRRQGESKFIVTGRGGLPWRPGDAYVSHYPTGNVRSIPSSSPSTETQRSFALGSDSSTNPTSKAPAPLVEAQGWVINAKGEVVLTAQSPNVTPNVPWMNPATCH